MADLAPPGIFAVASAQNEYFQGSIAPPCMDENPATKLPAGVYYQAPGQDHRRQVLTWTAPDGTTQNYVRYSSRHDNTRHLAYLYLHGIESHAAWFDEAADYLTRTGADVFALDRRGSGLNREAQGFPSGHVASAEVLLDDVDAAIVRLRKTYQKVVVIGLSWGGKLGLAHSLFRENKPDGLVLITPGVASKIQPSFALKWKVLASAFFQPTRQFIIPIRPEMFTTDPFFLERMAADPLRLRSVSARFYMESRRLDRRVARAITGNTVPMLTFFAGQDQIIDNQTAKDLLRRGGNPGLDIIVYKEQVHSLQFDAPRQLVDDILKWTQEQELLLCPRPHP